MLHINYFPEQQDYEPIWRAMQHVTKIREQTREQFCDQLWLLEHKPVFTQGLAGKPEHILNAQGIPVIHSDRGGQVTYHGPGQLMAYTLFDLDRKKLNTREFVRKLERVVIQYLATLGIDAKNNPCAPGIYVDGAKIGSIGLRVRQGFCYHGLAFNIAMDLTPFSYINPCGYTALRMTQLSDFTPLTVPNMINDFITTIIQEFGYNQWQQTSTTLRDLIA